MEYAAYKIIAGKNHKKELRAVEQYFRKSLSGKKLDRLYWGPETCSRLLPSVAELKQMLRTLKEKKLPLTFVSPAMLNDPAMSRLKVIFDHLDKSGASTEVVVNDWGALELIGQYRNLVPILGRSLNKGEKDPRPQYGEMGRSRRKVLRDPITSNNKYIEYLISRKVAGIEFDNVRQGIEFGRKALPIDLHLYFPMVMVSLTRVCLFASTFLPEKKKFRIEACKNECLDYLIERNKPETATSRGFKAYQISKGIYYENCNVPGNLRRYKRTVITVP